MPTKNNNNASQRSRAGMLEQMYEFVVPDALKETMGGVGIMGGLSFTVSF